MVSGIFSDQFTIYQFCQFTICDMPSVFLDFEALYLRAYWLERYSFLKLARQGCN